MPSGRPPAQPAWPDALSEVAKHNIVTNESKAVGQLVATTADGPMKSVVTTRWHLILHKELGDQLYDWVHDPGETNNLINTPLGQQAARGLNARLETLLARSAEQNRIPTSIALRDGRFELSRRVVFMRTSSDTDRRERLTITTGWRPRLDPRWSSKSAPSNLPH